MWDECETLTRRIDRNSRAKKYCLNRFNFELAYNNNPSKFLGTFNETVRVGSKAEKLFTQVV
jgi:hypothetical protein